MAFEPYRPAPIEPYRAASGGAQPGDFKAGGVVGAVQNFAQGVAKGGTSTLLGIGGVAQKVQHAAGSLIDMIPGVNVAPQAKGQDSVFNRESAAGQKAREIVAPEGTAQQLGFSAEQAAEFFLPAFKAARAEKAVDLIARGISSPAAAAATRIVGKGAVQAAATAPIAAAQTGGDLSDTAATAALAGGVRAGMAVIGEGARALKIPERVYSTIFKNSKSDMLAELKAGGVETLQRRNPELFTKLVQDGVIKFGPNGAAVNETLAEQALDRGLRGSIKHMADEVVEGIYTSEDNARTIASRYTGTVDLSEPQFVKVLKQIGEEYEDVGFGEISDKAKGLAASLEASKGAASAEDALSIRRFLDGMRLMSSFDKPASKLSLTQSNFKTLADTARRRVNSIPEMSETMKDYGFYLEALESLAKEAARRGNNQVISLIDSIFLGGAVIDPVPMLTMGAIRRMLLSGPGSTGLGQTLYKSAASPATIGALGGASRGAQSLLSDQEPQ